MSDNTIAEVIGYLEPYRGVIGLDEKLVPHGGFDERYLEMAPSHDEEDLRLCDPASRQDRLLLAEEMIRRWTDYKNALENNSDFC